MHVVGRWYVSLVVVTFGLVAAGCGDDDGGPTDGGAGDGGPAPDGGPDRMDSGTDGGAGDGGTAVDGGRDAGPTDAGPPPDPLEGAGEPELVQGGFEFLEGPQWRGAEGDLLFSDIPANIIYRLVEPDTITPFRDPSDNANGLALDPDGRPLAAEHGSRQVTRTLGDGSREPVASTFEGDQLNSPNDIAVRSDGTIYFTDPPYGLSGRTRELSFNGVFRLAPGGTLTAEHEGAESSRPNGIALSPDETVLYVADTASGDVTAWDVAADGSLSGMGHFATTAGGPDGMAVDEWGNLYVTSADGVEVFAPDGSRWGAIGFPMGPANCAFGGDDLQTLYVTAQEGLYRVRLPVVGLP